MSGKLKAKILNSFQVQGLTLRRESSQYLEQMLGQLEPDQQVDWIQQIISWLQGQSLESALISKDLIVTCIKQCSSISEQQQQVFRVISAFEVPAFSYNNDRKKFLRHDDKRRLFPEADSKAELYCERYKIVQQRTLRHRLFAAPTAASMLSSTKHENYKLCSCESLIGMANKANKFVVVLGMLTQLKEGKLFLEDPTGSVQLNLSKANFSQALITEGSIVLAEGTYDDKMFNVQAIGFAPAEPAKISREYFGTVNYFGGDAAKCMKTDSALKELEEQQLDDSMLVILSDVWLDDVKTMERLKILFTGYSQCPPTAFILLGNFLRNSLGFQDVATLKDCFKQLADLIVQFPDIVSRSRFIFVPGNRDPLTTKVVPRPPLPKVVTEYFTTKLPQSSFTSNPARVQLYTQEIVLFREDTISKMCRNSVYVPWESDSEVQMSQLYVKNLIGNAHLCPLPTHIAPVLWQWDHAMSLYPTPDLVVCADKHEAFTVSQNDCIFTNPGQFTKGDFCFKVYLPGQKKVEDSQICEPE